MSICQFLKKIIQNQQPSLTCHLVMLFHQEQCLHKNQLPLTSVSKHNKSDRKHIDQLPLLMLIGNVTIPNINSVGEV